MTKHYSAILVATELFPFTRGGIGVLYGNLLQGYASPEKPVLFVNATYQNFPLRDFRALYPGADLVNVTTILENTSALPASAFRRTADWHHQSYRALKAIEQLAARGVTADVLEFQDFGGLAAATLSSVALGQVRIAPLTSVRIHGPEIVLRRHTPRAPWQQHLSVMDLELLALTQADLLVCHVPGVVAEVQDALGMPDLVEKVIMQRPPVGLVNGMTGQLPRRTSTAGSPRAVFASKLDAIKAPDVFLRGVLMAHKPRKHETPLLLASRLEGDPAATAGLMRMVEESSTAVKWLPDATQSARREILASSAVVIPSPFEAFCLLAYEVALLGGRPVLNATNPAFGDDSPWIDEENCWKFDGSSRDLARVLSGTLDRSLREPLRWECDERPYWDEITDRPTASSISTSNGDSTTPASISVVVTNKNLGEFAGDCFQSLVDQVRRPTEVLVVDDASDLYRRELHAALSLLADERIAATYVQNSVTQGLGASRNIGLDRSTSDYVLFLDVDDILDPLFLERAGHALDTNPELDVVVPFVSCIAEYSDYLVGIDSNVLSFVGSPHFARYVANTSSSATCLIRRSCLPDKPFDEHLVMYEDWDLWCRLSDRGAVFAVDHKIGLWYRQRPGSMSAVGRGTVDESYALDRIRGKAIQRGEGTIPTIVLSDHAGPPVTLPAIRDAIEAPIDPADLAKVEQLELSLDRLRRVEEEAAAILGRRSVRLATKLADLRRSPSTRRRLRDQSVLGDPALQPSQERGAQLEGPS